MLQFSKRDDRPSRVVWSAARADSSPPPEGALHDSGASQPPKSSDDFSSLVSFLEDRFSGRTSIHIEGRVVHSTMRERVLVWLLLAATVGIVLAAVLRP